MKRIFVAFALLAVLVPVAIAQADAVQEFSFQVKDIKSNGRFTVVFTSRTYDSTGGVPPPVRENYIRLPAGAKLIREVRRKKYQCDVDRLIDDLQANPEPGKLFANRVKNLKSLIRTLKKSKAASDRKALVNAERCQRSHIGQGTAQVDARPLFDELIPSVFFMFLGKPNGAHSVATFQIIGMPDETSDIVKKLPTTVQGTRVPFILNFVDDPTPDGKYGYKIVFPTGPIAGLNLVIAEVNAVNYGITVKKKKTTCRKRKHGRCVKKKVKVTKKFWFTQPTCPPSGKLSFQAFYGYDDPQPDITKTIELACPQFSR